MTMFIVYAVVAVIAAAVASVISDRSGSGSGAAVLLTGLLWPVVVVGLVQLALWTEAVKLVRTSARTSTPAQLRELATSASSRAE